MTQVCHQRPQHEESIEETIEGISRFRHVNTRVEGLRQKKKVMLLKEYDKLTSELFYMLDTKSADEAAIDLDDCILRLR